MQFCPCMGSFSDCTYMMLELIRLAGESRHASQYSVDPDIRSQKRPVARLGVWACLQWARILVDTAAASDAK
jgi:hypothetical protein